MMTLLFQESEDLRERMMTMEAELRALRDELSNRSSLASTTSSQATVKEKEATENNPEAAAAETKTENDEITPPEAKRFKKEAEAEAAEAPDKDVDKKNT